MRSIQNGFLKGVTYDADDDDAAAADHDDDNDSRGFI